MLQDKSTQPSIFFIWLPLAMMWALMAIEQPIIAAVVARSDDAVRQLAAFGVTFSLALFIEGPIIQMLAAGTALADSRENYQRLLNIMHVIGWSATLLHALLCLPMVFVPFATKILGIPGELIETARIALLSMLPWTVAVGYRRLWQGVLIRYGKTKVIPVTMLVRITVSILVLVWGDWSQILPGAVLGGLALSLGVIAGAIASWIYVAPVIRTMPSIKENGNTNSRKITGTPLLMSWGGMILFYLPLALTNFLNLGARPVMQMGLARGPLPMESLAIWPISMGYLFLYTSFSLSSQEVVISRLNGPESRRALLRFNTILSLILGSLYVLVLVTPLWRFWFGGISGLSNELTELSRLPLIFALPVIPISAYISLFRGALVRLKRTAEVTVGIAINVSVLLTCLFTGVVIIDLPGIATVSAAYALGFAAELIYLAIRRPLKEFK